MSNIPTPEMSGPGIEQQVLPKSIELQKKPISGRAKSLLNRFTGWIRRQQPNPDAALQEIAAFPSATSENDRRGAPTQRRFDRLMEVSRAAVFRKPEVLGTENLAEIPANAPLVIATSHISDNDIPTIESELRQRLKETRPSRGLGISLQSDNLADPRTAPFIIMAGREHFFEYDVRMDKKTQPSAIYFQSCKF